MAHDALHLFFLDRIAAAPGLTPEIAELLRTHAPAAELGALLIDIPYFEGFATKVAGHFTGAVEAPSLWGDRFHQSSAFALLRALLDVARDQPDPAPLRALALGHLSHAVLDLVTHPHVNRFVRTTSPDHPHAQHRLIENAQLELWHRATFQRPLFGTRALACLARSSTSILRGAPWLAGFSNAMRLATGDTPTAGEWRRWTLGLWQYTTLVCTPLARYYVAEKDITSLSPWFSGPELVFADLWEHAIDRAVADSVRLWELAQSSAGLDRVTFARQFPEQNLDDPESSPRPL